MGKRTRSIIDPVHGLVRVTDTEMRVLDHELFRRLKRIRQNGLLYLVFPGATHSRFEHSIGALFVAHGMLNSLYLNSRVGLAKSNVLELSSAKSGHAIAFSALPDEDRDFIYSVTRLAALVHDLGHGPLSHTFDSFAPLQSGLKHVLSDPRLKMLLPLRDQLLRASAGGGDSEGDVRVPHEIMSCVLFAVIWNSLNGDPDYGRAVCASILGQSAADGLTSAMARRWVPLVHDVMASAPADADRMDYLERDSRAIGVTYGLFDRNRVLKSLLCYAAGDVSDLRVRLGIKRSGLQAIENLLQARYELFAQIYYHKTNRAVSLMLKSIAEHAAETELFSDGDLSQWVDHYRMLSDESFIDFLRGLRPEIGKTSAAVKELANRIHARDIWKRIMEPGSRRLAESVLQQLHAEFTDSADAIRLDETPPRALKDIDDGAALLIRNTDGFYVTASKLTWQGESPLIASLKQADASFARIYYTGSDPTRAKKIRTRSLQILYEHREAQRESH